MLASTQMDAVVGVDVHWELVPMPAPTPTPIPNPFVGMVLDPLGFAVGAVISAVLSELTGSPPTGAVFVNMLPATNTGTEATGFGHILIPPGTGWAPIPSVMPVVAPKVGAKVDTNPASPDNDAVVITGSKTVEVMGSNFARFGDMAMSCSEPVRLPSSVIMALPKGNPVLVGGPPTMDAGAAAGAFIRTKWVSHQLNNLLSYIRNDRLRNALSRLVCFFTGHPVDVASGRVFTDHMDVDLPGPLPLRIERVYNSGFSARSGPMGYGWSHSLDQKVWRERGKVVYLAEDGREIEFDTFAFADHRVEAGGEVFQPIDRLTLKCLGENRWEIWTPDGICHDFEPVLGGDPEVARLVRKRTRDDHRIELHYDEQGRLSWVRDSSGRRVLFENDALGRVLRIKLPVARGEGHFEHLRYTYDEHGDLVMVTDAAARSWRFQYTGHLLTCETDRERLSFYFGYDGIGQDAWCVRTWGDGGIYDHELTYDKVNKVTAVTNSLGQTTIYKMNLVGLVTEIMDPHGASTRYDYDPDTLQKVGEVDELGNTTRHAHDARGNRVRVETADGAVTVFEHDERFLDAPVRAIDPNGGEWRWRYDGFGRMVGRANPFGHWTRFEYEGGLLRRATSPGGAVTELEYDDAKNVSRVSSATGAVMRLEHDRLGRVVKIVNARGGVERREHDALGNLVRVEEAHGVVRRFEYDGEQNLVRAQDVLRDVAFTYTGYHRVQERHEAGTTVRFHYDTEDQLVSVENEAGEHYGFELDACGRVSVETGFDGFARRYARDAAGRVTKVTKASRRTSELSYDALGRITDVAHSDGTFERYRYGRDGSLLEASNDAAEVRFERDAMGRVVREETRVADGGVHWIKSGYGPDGHRVRVESSDGHKHHIERDLGGDVTRVELEGAWWGVDFERDPLGLELGRAFPSGVSSHWERDLVGRPMRRTVIARGADGSSQTMGDKRYQWEGDDQIRAILDPQLGDAHYKHDARGRLVWAKLPWGEPQHRAMDAVGNIYRTPDLSDRRYGPGGRIEEAEGTRYVHDADGNLIEKSDILGDTTRYRWNGAGMLSAVELPGGREVSFAYDVLARRLTKQVFETKGAERPLKEVRWSWDGHTPLTELDSDEGKTTWVFEPETFNPLAKLAQGQVWGVLTDQIGTPTELIAQDGSVAWRGEIDTYGKMVSEIKRTKCPFRWPGQMEDDESGLSYNRFRYYVVDAGLYTSHDRIGIRGGLHQASYPADPTQWCDPFALFPLVFPSDPSVFSSMVNHPGVWSTTQHGTTRVRWQLSETLRVRYESHPEGLLPGDPSWNPRHHGPHYHVEVRANPAQGWNASGNKLKIEPPGYTHGSGTGFIPDERLPGQQC